MTLSDLKWPFHASPAISAVAELFVLFVRWIDCQWDYRKNLQIYFLKILEG